jgi:hypothetical protein
MSIRQHMQSKCHTEFVEHDQNFEEIDNLFNIIPPFPYEGSGLCADQEDNRSENTQEPIITTHTNEIMRSANSSCKAKYLESIPIEWFFC